MLDKQRLNVPIFFGNKEATECPRAVGPIALVLFLIVLLFRPFLLSAQTSVSATSTADLPPGAMQSKATTACLECHEARIILQQRLSKTAWTKEVDKMVKWGAVVDASDHDALVDYLATTFAPDKPAYDPPRTSSEKATRRESK